MARKFFVVLVFIIFYLNSWAQELTINCNNQPVNQILISLRDNHGFQCSFNDKQLSKYSLTVNQTFASTEEAIKFILSGIPFTYEKYNDVYLILPDEDKLKPEKKILTGRIIDKYSLETLPFAHLLINGDGMVTDVKGEFSYASTDSIFHVKASYLGYYILDTTILPGINNEIALIPSSIEMKEVVIQGDEVEHTVQIGSEPGLIRLNNKLGYVMPGNGDNSVFNLLRLQPGILASGEQSNGIIIWGSGEGQSQVKYDGFTIYGLKNFNDNISTVNPFVAKDIQVLKGGYSAEFGERIGGIINITGVDGNKYKPDLKLSLNNMTFNTIASVPLFKNSSLVMAYRQTFYNIYDSLNMVKKMREDRGNNQPSNSEINTVYPDYRFKDFNIKYAGNSSNGDNYFINFSRGWDSFKYSFKENKNRNSLESTRSEKNEQFGSSAFYGKKWKNGTISNITLGYSGIESTYSKNDVSSRKTFQGALLSKSVNERALTSLNEFNGRIDNIFSFNKNQSIETGVGFVYDEIELQDDSLDLVQRHEASNIKIFNVYVTDDIQINKKTKLKVGARADYPINLNKIYFQPRISVQTYVTNTTKIYSSWGLYNQFISLNPTFDSIGNYNYFWSVSDIDKIPVLKSNHFVLGYLYNHNDFTLSVEGFIKNTSGVTSLVQANADSRKVINGNSKSKGVDVFVKKDFNRHTAWISYTLSETLERYIFELPIRRELIPFISDEYIPALHDQRHELKLAALANFKPFYFSGNYVYGSGFPKIEQQNPERTAREEPYKRFDVAVYYKFNTKKMHAQIGISVLNVFSHENVKYSSFLTVPNDQNNFINVKAESIPFTPLLNLSVSF